MDIRLLSEDHESLIGRERVSRDINEKRSGKPNVIKRIRRFAVSYTTMHIYNIYIFIK